MALVTIDAVVHIPVDVWVEEVGCVITAMTARALEYGIVVRVRVAHRANTTRGVVGVRGWELRVLGVIERRTRPGGRVVAVLARGREELWLRRVAGVGGVVVISLMAADTGRRHRGVVAVDVAVIAYPRRYRVRTGQREGRIVVVEGRICPYSRVMAEFARCREAASCMGRIGRAGVILLVAGVAERAVQRVAVVDMAIGTRARRHSVRSGQWEAGGGMIKLAVGPQHRIVAALASSREMRGDMVHRAERRVVVVLVARHASRVRQIVVVADVAIGTRARRNDVRSGQSESRSRVIELPVCP